jgi:type VI protein secretion system component Hcp
MNRTLLPNRPTWRHLRHAALVAALVTTAAAAPRFVMKIADREGRIVVAGDCAAPGYEGWIDVESFGQGVHRPLTEPFFDATRFTFHKPMDASSPYLALAAMKGKSIDSVEFRYLAETASGVATEPVAVQLLHARVTAYRTGGGDFSPLGPAAGSRPMEEITLVWSEMVFDYQTHDEEGNLLDTAGVELVAYESTEDPNFDDDGDGLPNSEDPDDDNDGIHDDYEKSNGLDAFRDDADGDLDGDNRSNYDEAVAETRADDPADFFGIDSLRFRRGADGLEAVVSLRVAPGRSYRLLATTDPGLPRESWFVVDQFDVSEEEGAGPVEITVPSSIVASAGRLFFGAEVDLTP